MGGVSVSRRCPSPSSVVAPLPRPGPRVLRPCRGPGAPSPFSMGWRRSAWLRAITPKQYASCFCLLRLKPPPSCPSPRLRSPSLPPSLPTGARVFPPTKLLFKLCLCRNGHATAHAMAQRTQVAEHILRRPRAPPNSRHGMHCIDRFGETPRSPSSPGLGDRARSCRHPTHGSLLSGPMCLRVTKSL